MDDVSGPSQILRASGVTVLSVGIGNRTDKYQLSLTASDPDEEHVFLVNTDENLGSIIPKIVEASCKGISHCWKLTICAIFANCFVVLNRVIKRKKQQLLLDYT